MCAVRNGAYSCLRVNNLEESWLILPSEHIHGSNETQTKLLVLVNSLRLAGEKKSYFVKLYDLGMTSQIPSYESIVES